MPAKCSSPVYGSEVLGKDSQLPNLLEMNPGIRELKHLLIGFLSSYFNLLSFFLDSSVKAVWFAASPY